MIIKVMILSYHILTRAAHRYTINQRNQSIALSLSIIQRSIEFGCVFCVILTDRKFLLKKM
jgi:hypothetical protein